MMKELKMKDLGETYYCLGMRITQNRKQDIITLDQKQCIDDLLRRFNMSECSGVQTPLDLNQNLFDM